MNSIFLEETGKTPKVNFDYENGKIELTGRSIPENPIAFYKPLLIWLEQYAQNPKQLTEGNFQLEYFNTTSSKCILDVFKRLEKIHKGGTEVVINWYYERGDEVILETGEDYQSIVDVPFKILEV